MPRRLVLELFGVGVVLVGVFLLATWALSHAEKRANPTRPSRPAAMQCAHWVVARCCQLLGVPVARERIVSLLPFRERGHSMLEISRALRSLGLSTEGRRESAATVKEFPCIAHLRSPDHFVVVVGMDELGVHLYDGGGRRSVRSRPLFEKRFGGEVIYPRLGAEPTVARSLTSQANRNSAPRIEFETLLLDKGALSPYGGPVPFVYKFRNQGSSPLTVAKVETDCKCIRSQAPTSPIAGGETGEVTLFYRVSSESGPFSHRAVIETDDPTHPTVIVEAAGYNGALVTVHPPRLNLGEIPRGRRRVAKCFIICKADGGAAMIGDVETTFATESVRKHVSRLPDERVGQPSTLGARRKVGDEICVVEVAVKPTDGEVALIDGHLSISTRVKGFEKLLIPFKAIVVPPVRAYPRILRLAADGADDAEKPRFTLLSLDDEAFSIEGVEPQSADLKWSYPAKTVTREAEVVLATAATGSHARLVGGIKVHVRIAASGEKTVVPVEVVY